MTNLEIAKVLLREAKAGRLEPAILPHFMNSLQYGGPVQDPVGWLYGVANDLPDFIIADNCREQLRDIAARWDGITKDIK